MGYASLQPAEIRQGVDLLAKAFSQIPRRCTGPMS
jgi:hypothetical protein